MKSFAAKVISFNKSITYNGKLPEGIRIMNPFRESEQALKISTEFYKKFYNDNGPRHIILGINPGRFGAGITGVPFTDTKRLSSECGFEYTGKDTHEPSATFVYEVIQQYGGPEKFYRDFYIHSVCPLGFTILNKKGREVNYNYYDSKELTALVYDFMVDNINKQLGFGINRDLCFCFGTGKNETFLKDLNQKFQFFKEIAGLEHPRFIMQYRSKMKAAYIEKYLTAFRRAVPV